MDTDNVQHVLWINKMFSCGTKRARQTCFATQSQHSVQPAKTSVSPRSSPLGTFRLFSGIDGFYCLLLALHMYVCMCRRFFENQTNEICSHSIEKPSKGRFFKPDKLQNHTNEGKGKEKRKSQEKERRKREKSNGCALSIYNGYFGDRFWPKINCWAEEVYLAIRFSKIWPDVWMCINIRKNLVVLAGDESTFF